MHYEMSDKSRPFFYCFFYIFDIALERAYNNVF